MLYDHNQRRSYNLSIGVWFAHSIPSKLIRPSILPSCFWLDKSKSKVGRCPSAPRTLRGPSVKGSTLPLHFTPPGPIEHIISAFMSKRTALALFIN